MDLDSTVIVVHETDSAGQGRTTDEDLFVSLNAIGKQCADKCEVMCAMSGPERDHARRVWGRRYGSTRVFRGVSTAEAVSKAIVASGGAIIHLLRSGDIWAPGKLAQSSTALATLSVYCHAMRVGSERTLRFFPGWEMVRAFFLATGLSLFHPPVSSMSFRRDVLADLLGVVHEGMPFGWELGTRLLLAARDGTVDFSTDIHGALRREVVMEMLGADQWRHLQSLGVRTCFDADAPVRFPAWRGLWRGRADIPAWEAQRFKFAANYCGTSAMLEHSPENLVLLALLMELGPGGWEPLMHYLETHPGMVHEREHAYGELAAVGAGRIRDEDLEAYARLGKRLWKRPSFLHGYIMPRLLHAGNGALANELYGDLTEEDILTRTLLVRCTMQATDGGGANEQEVQRLVAEPKEKMSLIEQVAVAVTLFQLEQWEGALEWLKAVREVIPYDPYLMELHAKTLRSLGRVDQAERLVREDARTLPINMRIRLLQSIGSHAVVVELLEAHFGGDGLDVDRIAAMGGERCGASLLESFLESVLHFAERQPLADAVCAALSQCKGYSAYDKGIAFKRLGMHEQGIFHLSQVAVHDDHYREAQYLRAGSLAALKRYEEAENAFRDVVAMEPGRLDVYLNIVDLYKNSKKWEKAIELLAWIREKDAHMPGLARRENDIREVMKHG